VTLVKLGKLIQFLDYVSMHIFQKKRVENRIRKTPGSIKDCCLSIGEKHGKISAIKLKIFQKLK